MWRNDEDCDASAILANLIPIPVPPHNSSGIRNVALPAKSLVNSHPSTAQKLLIHYYQSEVNTVYVSTCESINFHFGVD